MQTETTSTSTQPDTIFILLVECGGVGGDQGGGGYVSVDISLQPLPGVDWSTAETRLSHSNTQSKMAPLISSHSSTSLQLQLEACLQLTRAEDL